MKECDILRGGGQNISYPTYFQVVTTTIMGAVYKVYHSHDQNGDVPPFWKWTVCWLESMEI